MYNLEFLPIAKNDMESIIFYVFNVLKNSSAAKKITESFIDGANNILKFPYGSSIYFKNESLNREYRSIRIKNFLIFYIIDEKSKTITIVRVLYNKMDINNILQQKE